jgi:hypothetical protein
MMLGINQGHDTFNNVETRQSPDTSAIERKQTESIMVNWVQSWVRGRHKVRFEGENRVKETFNINS